MKYSLQSHCDRLDEIGNQVEREVNKRKEELIREWNVKLDDSMSDVMRYLQSFEHSRKKPKKRRPDDASLKELESKKQMLRTHAQKLTETKMKELLKLEKERKQELVELMTKSNEQMMKTLESHVNEALFQISLDRKAEGAAEKLFDLETAEISAIVEALGQVAIRIDEFSDNDLERVKNSKDQELREVLEDVERHYNEADELVQLKFDLIIDSNTEVSKAKIAMIEAKVREIKEMRCEFSERAQGLRRQLEELSKEMGSLNMSDNDKGEDKDDVKDPSPSPEKDGHKNVEDKDPKTDSDNCDDKKEEDSVAKDDKKKEEKDSNDREDKDEEDGFAKDDKKKEEKDSNDREDKDEEDGVAKEDEQNEEEVSTEESSQSSNEEQFPGGCEERKKEREKMSTSPQEQGLDDPHLKNLIEKVAHHSSEKDIPGLQ